LISSSFAKLELGAGSSGISLLPCDKGEESGGGPFSLHTLVKPRGPGSNQREQDPKEPYSPQKLALVARP